MIARLALIAALSVGQPAAAQSMNVPGIVRDVMGQICAPYAEDGNIIQAIAAARALGYRPEGHWADHPIAPNDPPHDISLTRRHHGTVTLAKNYNRGLCAVGIAEGGPSNMGPAAEPFLRALGMEPVVDIRDEQPLDMFVWRGTGRQVVIAASPRFTPGSELVLSFDTNRRRRAAVAGEGRP
ncbi:MAG: hypothetical protein KKA16_12865 [Alphaproteobacteria bacterium]|nr:hypothetical protein [Alphaproteobacteria bacterium]MBU2380321.1 hypothetical protein [Alphaproteobacteria bacterium]